MTHLTSTQGAVARRMGHAPRDSACQTPADATTVAERLEACEVMATVLANGARKLEARKRRSHAEVSDWLQALHVGFVVLAAEIAIVRQHLPSSSLVSDISAKALLQKVDSRPPGRSRPWEK